jgi:hypothetical protein
VRDEGLQKEYLKCFFLEPLTLTLSPLTWGEGV